MVDAKAVPPIENPHGAKVSKLYAADDLLGNYMSISPRPTGRDSASPVTAVFLLHRCVRQMEKQLLMSTLVYRLVPLCGQMH